MTEELAVFCEVRKRRGKNQYYYTGKISTATNVRVDTNGYESFTSVEGFDTTIEGKTVKTKWNTVSFVSTD